MSVSFIGLFKPLAGIIPEVEKPKNKNSITKEEKIIWTGITLFIYLVCCQIPIYGINRSTGADPLFWMRAILASNRGTLMELGISPIVSASMILQVLAGTGVIRVDYNVKEDRVLFEQVQKILGVLMAVCEAIAYTFSGMYGDVSEMGYFTALLIVIQLSFSGIVVMLLDDMLQKGYGLGSGISLFIATNICETILWKCLSPLTITSGSGTEFEGSIVNFVHLMLTKPGLNSLTKAFNRASAPNLTAVFATVFIIAVVIYLQGFKVEIPLFNNKMRGQQSSFPIKLFYTSNIPIIMQSYFISNLYFISQILHRRFQNNFLVNLIGKWSEASGRSVPIGGLAYYFSPPTDFAEIVADPVRFLVYVTFVLVACGLFARYWIEISGDSTKAVVKKFTDAQVTIRGKRDESMIKQLDRLIPTAAALGGVAVGLLTVVADFLGAIGSGTGILLAVTIVYGYFEYLTKKGNASVEQF